MYLMPGLESDGVSRSREGAGRNGVQDFGRKEGAEAVQDSDTDVEVA
jgi:hypothetical protein